MLDLSILHDFKITVLLVDDQLIIAEAVKKMLKNQVDIAFHYCSDPTKAIQLAEEIHPTVILQDLVMPDVEGLLLVKYFRANANTKDIPLIVLSSKEEPKIKAEAFALGANDYMVKLPDEVELIARIRYHSAGYIRLLERNEAYEKLAESQRILQAELLEAATYVTSLLPLPIKREHKEHEIVTDWRFIPSTQLGGDAFGYHWLNPQHFCLYLLDVCGHGVGAAVLSISIMNVLRTQSLPHVDFLNPSSVLYALNETFPMEKHNNMFFTMWYGVYNAETRCLVYSTGGHPPAILLTGSSESKFQVVELKTDGLIVGGIEGTQFESQSYKLDKFSKLYIFSDGIYEIAQADGSTYPLQEFINVIAQLSTEYSQNSLTPILKYVTQLNGQVTFADDVSIIEVRFF